jgi:hypothetical protein
MRGNMTWRFRPAAAQSAFYSGDRTGRWPFGVCTQHNKQLPKKYLMKKHMHEEGVLIV